MRTILVPTDFSEGAHVALERAKRLPLAPQARLVLLHVVPLSLKDSVLRESVAAGARVKLARLIESTKTTTDARIEGEVVIGEPFEEIIAHADAIAADLVVVGRHGRRAVRDLLIGTTAERTIRHGTTPVLVATRTDGRAYERPLLTTDLGDSALQAARTLLTLVTPVRTIAVLHASQPPFVVADDAEHPGQLRDELVRMAHDRMNRLVPQLERECRASWIPLVRPGDPRNVILDVIAAGDIDLVALGTHGRAGIARLFLGSVAERVLAAARCDVLVVRPRNEV